MKIKYDYFLRRKRTTLKEFINGKNFKTYEDLSSYLISINVAPPEKKEVDELMPDKKKKVTRGRTVKKESQPSVSKIEKIKRVKKDNANKRTTRSKQKNTPKRDNS